MKISGSQRLPPVTHVPSEEPNNIRGYWAERRNTLSDDACRVHVDLQIGARIRFDFDNRVASAAEIE